MKLKALIAARWRPPRWRWPAARSTAPEQQADKPTHPHRLPDLPQRRPDRQEQQVARRSAARLQHQVDQVRLRRRREHRVHRQGARLRRAGFQPGGARAVGPAEHPLQGGVRSRRRRRQRGAGGPQRQRHQHDRRTARQADRHAVRVDGALQPAGRAGAERPVRQRRSARRPAAAGDRWRRGTAATSTPPTPGCRRWTSCARTARI